MSRETHSRYKPLTGISVVEIGGGAAGAYCGRLLVDAGARVLSTAVDESRRSMGILRGDLGADAEADAAFAAYLGLGKEQVSLNNDTIANLILQADLVLIGEEAGIKECPQPRYATIALSWFGDRGEYRNWRGSDLVIQALTGIPKMAGCVDGPPQGAGDRQATMVAGVTAYIAACAALLAGLRRGSASTHSRLDVSILDANLVLSEMHLHLCEHTGAPMERLGINRYFPTAPCGIYPCRNGWVGITTATPDQWRALFEALQLSKLFPGGETLTTREMRFPRLNDLENALSTALRSRDAQEWAALGRELRIPMVVVPDAAGILSHPIFTKRESLAALEVDGKSVRIPRSPFDLEQHVYASRSHSSGAQRSPLPLPTRTNSTVIGGMQGLLAGVKLVDFSMGWAGPLASRMLADFGAEVWKIEAARYPDWWRGVNWTPQVIENKEYEKAKIYTAMNRGKLGISLDLTDPVGRQIALDLVSKADAVIENQAAGVMKKFGLDWEDLCSSHPDLVMVSMSAFGTGNEWSATRAYGSTLEHGSGLPSLVGKEGDPPTMSHVALGDPVGGLYGCAAMLTALLDRQRTGDGHYVNVSMVEAVLQFATPALLEFQLREKFTRLGNRNAAMAPQGIYKATGKDGWFACTVASAKEFSELAKLIGRPDLANDKTLISVAGRQLLHDKIDAAINTWASSKSPQECAQALQEIGIAASEVLNIADLLDHRHMNSSELFIDIDRELSGKQRQIGTPFFQDGKRINSFSAAPLLGQHTFDVLTRVTGVTAARFDELVASGVISFAPKPVRNLVTTPS